MVQAKISNLQTWLLNGTLAHSPHEMDCFRLFKALKTLALDVKLPLLHVHPLIFVKILMKIFLCC